MATARPFAYNTGAPISGTDQVGSLAIGTPTVGFDATGLEWWNGPDEDLGYVIAEPVPGDTQPTPVIGVSGSVGFFRSDTLTEGSFIGLADIIAGPSGGGPFATGTDAKTWLNNNGYWTSYSSVVTTGLKVYLDALNPASYPGSGTTWYDLSGNGNDVSMQNSGSITWSPGPTGYFSTVGNGWFNRTSASNVPTGNSPYTLSAWVQLGSSWNGNGFMSIGPFGNGNEANAFRAGSTNQLLNYWWGNDLSVNISVSPTNGWFNAVAKYDGTTRSIWVNGVLAGSDAPVGHNVTSSDIQISKTAGNEYLQGNIAQALIYNVALSGSEILANFNASKSRFGL